MWGSGCHFCAPQTPLLGSVLTKKWREWGPLDDQMRPKASKIHPKMHLKTTPNDTWEDRVSLRVRRVPAPCQKYLKLYKKTGKRIQFTYVFLRWILKGSVCKTIQLCKKSVNRGGLGEAHVDIRHCFKCKHVSSIRHFPNVIRHVCYGAQGMQVNLFN